MKNKVTRNSTPEEYSTVCPYLMVESVEKQIDFLKQVFNAEIKEEKIQADGKIMHGEVRLGDSVIMMGRSRPEFPPQPNQTYVFVDDVDHAYRQALKLNATSIMEPGDRPYGLREGGVKDEYGNTWWIAQPIRK